MRSQWYECWLQRLVARCLGDPRSLTDLLVHRNPSVWYLVHFLAARVCSNYYLQAMGRVMARRTLEWRLAVAWAPGFP